MPFRIEEFSAVNRGQSEPQVQPSWIAVDSRSGFSKLVDGLDAQWEYYSVMLINEPPRAPSAVHREPSIEFFQLLN